MLQEAALGASSGFLGSRKAPHVPALTHPQHSFLEGCISAFFTLFLYPLHLCLLSSVTTVSQSLSCSQPGLEKCCGDVQFVTGNSDLCHLVLSQGLWKQRVPMQPHVFCCLLLCEAWNSLRLCMYPPLPGAGYPANAKRHFDSVYSVFSFLQGISAVKLSESLVQAE